MKDSGSIYRRQWGRYNACATPQSDEIQATFHLSNRAVGRWLRAFCRAKWRASLRRGVRQ